MSERYRVVASFDGWGQAGVYIGDTRFCIAPSKENAERIAAALNSVEGIATQSNAQAGVVEALQNLADTADAVIAEERWPDSLELPVREARAALAAVKGVES